MNVHDLPSDRESSAEPPDVVLRTLARALDYAEGFWLGFIEYDTPVQRRKLAAVCHDLLKPLNVRVIEVESTRMDFLLELKEFLNREQNELDMSTAHAPKLVFFVHGLERWIPPSEKYPPLLSYLNLKRELFRQMFPHPLAIWLPSRALNALARGAPDFWAWRSGVYRLAPEPESLGQPLELLSDEAPFLSRNLSEPAKRAHLAMLEGLLSDYRRLGSGPRERKEQGNILLKIGAIHRELGELIEAKQAFEESLAIAREQRDLKNIAELTHNLGITARHQDDYDDAKRLYHESLRIRRALHDHTGVASSLYQLGLLARLTGDYNKAGRRFERSIKLSRQYGDDAILAASQRELGVLAQESGDYELARRFHKETIPILEELGDRWNQASSLRHQGTLARLIGDYAEARRLYEASLGITGSLGDKFGAARTLYRLAWLEQETGNYPQARQLYEESLKLNKELGSKLGIAEITARLGQLAEAEKDHQKALQLWMAALGTLREIHSPQARFIEQWLAGLKRDLGDEKYQRIATAIV